MLVLIEWLMDLWDFFLLNDISYSQTNGYLLMLVGGIMAHTCRY